MTISPSFIAFLKAQCSERLGHVDPRHLADPPSFVYRPSHRPREGHTLTMKACAGVEVGASRGEERLHIYLIVLRVVLIVSFIFGALSHGERAAATDAPNGLSGIFGESDNPASVVAATGGMSYSVPFELPAARGSVQPNLALTYASDTFQQGLRMAHLIPPVSLVS
jgi:hypothetical protein